jgi:hypothetical protein
MQSEKNSAKSKGETMGERQYLFFRDFILRMNLLQHRPQGSPKNMSLPYQPPVLEADSRRNEGEVNRNWDEKVSKQTVASLGGDSVRKVYPV